MEDDILSQGGDRDPSPWPRRLAVIAAVIAVIAGGVVYLTRPHHQAPAAAHPATASPSPSASGVLTAPPGPDGILGQTLAWDRGLRLPDAGDQPAWFSPASGGAEPIGGLPPAPSGYQFTRVAGGWAVQAGQATRTSCGGCAGAPTAVWFLPDGAQSVTRLGAANRVAPAATPGAVWLTTYPPGDKPAGAAGTAREAGAGAGTAAARPVRLPPGYAITQGTLRGLLLEPLTARPGVPAAELWDPGTGRTTRTFDQVLAVSPAEVAWASGCTPRCGVQALNLSTGKQTALTLPAGSSVTSAAFSPDGKFIALQVSFGNTGDGGELAMQLEAAPVTGSGSGRLTPVPGTWVSSDALVGFGWPGGGDSLVAEFSFTTKMQLASWQPGASRPAVTVVRPGPDQAALILG